MKIADFGWSIHVPKKEAKRMTMCGTMDYLAPEMVEEEPHDDRVDVWCLGVLCYELCTGSAPFEAKSQADTYSRILSIDLKMPSHLSPAVQNFIKRLLTKDPEDRIKLDEILLHPWFLENGV